MDGSRRSRRSHPKYKLFLDKHFKTNLAISNPEVTPMSAYNEFIDITKDIHYISSVLSLLEWDQQVMMPPEGFRDRGQQLAAISALEHEKLTSKKLASLLEELQKPANWDSLSPEQQVNVREVAREHTRAASQPLDLIRDLAKASSEGFKVWENAKKKSDFPKFLPCLEKLLELKKRQAECIGYKEIAYDALIEDFEPGMTTKRINSIFSGLKVKLIPMVTRIVDSGIQPNLGVVQQPFSVNIQKTFNHDLAEAIGYDFQRGRIDIATHPFTAGSNNDTRITTRYFDDDIRPSVFATIHEVGHAIYEQGYLPEHMGTPMGEYVSFGIHESQSRLWENCVGRSLPFWRHFYPGLQSVFPSQFNGHDVEAFHAAINDVRPSLVRVEADEVTYGLHIILRFEIEQLLISGELEARDSPQAWNERIEKFFGLEVPDDANGVLQDVHWSSGGFGYFPSYSLGNMYAAQFMDKAEKDMPDLYSQFEQGKFDQFLGWLRENIHHKGKFYNAEELVEDVTGQKLDPDVFVAYLNKKFGKLYGF
jgi:carboxypeptidase Taq